MNKKCRLLVTAKCPNNCPLCCNKQFDLFKDVSIIDRWDYDEFIITGGEPLTFPKNVIDLIDIINFTNACTGRESKFYLYTSICNPSIWDFIASDLDGITYTVHTTDNAKELIQLINVLRNYEAGYDTVFSNLSLLTNKSLWLNLFPEGKDFIDEELAKSQYSWNDIAAYFKIKQMEWKKNCPVPEGEDFRRINNLW